MREGIGASGWHLVMPQCGTYSGGIHMAAGIVRLRTRNDRLKAEQAELVRQAVLSLPDLPAQAVSQIVATIDRQTSADNEWTFVMMSPADNAKVVDWLMEHSKRPQLAVRLWAKLFLNLRRDTGEIVQTRDELADSVGATAEHVSRVMTELETVGAISRKRVKVAGMRGPGMVRYFMNPHVATHETGKARATAQASFGKLRLVPPA